MSQENVEKLQAALAAFNRRDKPAWLALSDPGLENIPPSDWPESDPVRGPEPVWEFLVRAQDVWESSPFEYVEVIDAGEDTVVADIRAEVRGKASGAAVAWSYWQVCTFRDGKLLLMEWFVDRAEALEAVGLRE
jgi:ketosteroid isomerase-like protein